MSPHGQAILVALDGVAHERVEREADPGLAAAVHAVKAYQQARFGHTYADMLASPHEGAAARFFLSELYGPQDFSRRDAQFARIVPALVRLFPAAIVGTVAELAQLHALSETLDSAMARALACAPAAGSGTTAIDGADYGRAWRAVGRPADREQQLQLMLAVGFALERYTRNPVLRHGLRAMRRPARAAGLETLQQFLETGFDTFGQLGKRAQGFLDLIAERERALFELLFSGDDGPAI
jgi:hypothetical protein